MCEFECAVVVVVVVGVEGWMGEMNRCVDYNVVLSDAGG